MANLDNCHGCGSRERPTDLERPAWDIGARFCPPCLELDESWLRYLAEQPPHYPNNINSVPMTRDELAAWGYPITGWRQKPLAAALVSDDPALD